MKKNGFTLIEILGVITLLALLSIIVIISVSKSLKDSIKTLSSVQIENIKSAAAMWRTDHIELIPDNDYYIVSLSELQSNGYIDDDIIDFKTEQAYSDDLLIEVGIDDVVVNDSLIKNGYKKLEYIESTGTQYILTDYYLKSNSDIDLKFQLFSSNESDIGILFGSRENNNKKAYLFGDASSGNGYLYGFYGSVDRFDDTYKIIENNAVYGNLYNLSIRGGNFDVFNLGSVSLSSNNFNMTYPMCIFGLNDTGDVRLIPRARIFSFKIRENNQIVKNFVPCLDKNNKAGLYDLVENKFYGNSGTGDFVYKMPKDVQYTYLDYIGTTGTQYIDLKYVAKTNTEVRLDVQFVPNTLTYVSNPIGDNIIGRETTTDVNNFSINFGANADQFNHIFYWIDKTYASGAVIKKNIYDTVLPRSVMIAKSGSATFQGVTHEVATKTGNNTENMLLFGHFDSSTNVINPFKRYDTKIYGFQIYEDGILIRNMIPAMRNSDNQAGLYDELNDVFYPNAGTGEFTYGVKDFNPYDEMYTKLEYIESTGTQYIKTDYHLRGNSNIEAQFTHSPVESSASSILFGARENSQKRGYMFGDASGINKWFHAFYGDADTSSIYKAITVDPEYNKIYNLSIKNGTFNVSDLGEVVFTSIDTILSSPMYIFAFNENESPACKYKGRIYYMKIFEGNAMILNFVPAKRNSDNAIGLYDEVNDVFYTNSGTGTFGYGELN